MSPEVWKQVDQYLGNRLLESDPSLDAALEASIAAELPPISVSPLQGKMLHLLARLHGASRILEIGTLGGYSTIWLARALPASGSLVTLEYEPKHAEIARANLIRAGVADCVEIKVGDALDTLPSLAGGEPFDFVFIDADKENTAEYFEWSLKLTRPGGVIVVDNVVRKGEVANDGTTDPDVIGIRRFLERAAVEPRVDFTAIQTVGQKGYDGFALALVLK